MNNTVKIGIVVLLAIVVGAVVLSKRTATSSTDAMPTAGAITADSPAALPSTQPAVAGIPRLVDLGATQCVPCKMMAPILSDLKRDMTGKLQVEFIDVWQNQSAGQQYGIRAIPTQIFYDASGKELSRHEGFLDRQGILGRFKEYGIELPAN